MIAPSRLQNHAARAESKMRPASLLGALADEERVARGAVCEQDELATTSRVSASWPSTPSHRLVDARADERRDGHDQDRAQARRRD